MKLFANSARQFTQFDKLAQGRSFVHRTDARLKLIVFIIYLACVISTPIGEVSALLPYFCFPLFIILSANLPLGYLITRMLVFLPFTLMVGVFNPLIETTPVFDYHGITITEGMLSFTSIVLRSILSILGAFVLITTTPIPALCHALTKLRLPRLLVNLLMFFYRYSFIFLEELQSSYRAYQLRRGRQSRLRVATWSSIIGHLLVSSIIRAKSIHYAIQCRGGEAPVFFKDDGSLLTPSSCITCTFFIVLLLLCRMYHLPKLIDSHLYFLLS
ncbi:MAG: cobalt ECF transporter T component CbiQ [Akkermansia sp.]|nr:cobalt ECF transporter T component CbiQ [Akkermansia sp.]